MKLASKQLLLQALMQVYQCNVPREGVCASAAVHYHACWVEGAQLWLTV